MRVVFFFNDTATTEIYTLSLHDALPIYQRIEREGALSPETAARLLRELADALAYAHARAARSEEHTSELQSPCNLVCRLLLEKKNRPVIATPPARTKETPPVCAWDVVSS